MRISAICNHFGWFSSGFRMVSQGLLLVFACFFSCFFYWCSIKTLRITSLELPLGLRRGFLVAVVCFDVLGIRSTALPRLLDHPEVSEFTPRGPERHTK